MTLGVGAAVVTGQGIGIARPDGDASNKENDAAAASSPAKFQQAVVVAEPFRHISRRRKCTTGGLAATWRMVKQNALRVPL